MFTFPVTHWSGAAADVPPCPTGNTYTATVSGSTDADGTYTMSNVGGQSWFVIGSTSWWASLDLSASPYTLVFQFGLLGPTVTYQTTSFDCSAGGTFDYVSETGSPGTWPATVSVAYP